MKKRANIRFVSAMAMITLVVLAVASCKKNAEKEIRNDQPVRAMVASCDTCTYANVDTLRGVISANKTLGCNTIWYLDGLVYVSGNSTLTIHPGTIIRGLPGNLTSNPRIPGGGLIITKGSQINAEGSETCPITFTSYREDGVQTPASGDWSGVVLLGRASTNNGTGNIVEGVPSNPPADATYGGTTDNDNSGILKYVVIKYAGFPLSDNNEINGLTMAGVGCGTTIDYVEVFKANDDAFEWFGGTVNAKHLIAVHPLDDMFDFDNGFKGHIQWALGVADPARADISTSNGIEADNNSAGSAATPKTRPVISNMTLIGYATSTLANSANRGRGNHWRRNVEFMLQNSIVLGFKEGLFLDLEPAQEKYLAPYASGKVTDSLKRNLVHAYNSDGAFVTNGPYTSLQFRTKAQQTSLTGCGDTLFQENKQYINADANLDIKLVSPFVPIPGFYRPQSTSPALSTSTGFGFTNCGFPGLPNACSFSFGNLNYVGAFSNSSADDWAVNWAIFED